MYFVLLCVHLLSAICFVGYVFFDCVIYPFALKRLPKEQCEEVKKAYSKGGAKVFGSLFGILIVSGVGLIGFYDFQSLFTLQSQFSVFFVLKMFLLVLMLALTAYSIYRVRFLKQEDPFGKYSHVLALLLCLGIVLCAKAMVQ